MKTEFTVLRYGKKMHLGVEVEWYDGFACALHLLFWLVALSVWREK